jgi:hypothetical protein
MDVSMENPAFTLPPEMILGLLGELSGSKNPHVKQFYELLAKHPASRSSRASSQAPSSLNLSSSLDVSGPGLDLVSAPISGSGLASSDNRCCRNGTKKGTFGPVRYQRKKGMVEEEGVVMEDKEASLESQRVSAEAEAEAEVEVEAEAEGGAGEVEKDGGMSEEDEDGSGGNVEEVSGGKRKRASRKGKKPKKKAKGDTPPKWLTDGSPPDLHTGTDTMVVELSRIISNAGLQSLADLTQVLIHPESIRSTDEPLLSLGALITACAQEEARQTLADFRHMILLIRLAFHLQR